jgi:hypothetical protein
LHNPFSVNASVSEAILSISAQTKVTGIAASPSAPRNDRLVSGKGLPVAQWLLTLGHMALENEYPYMRDQSVGVLMPVKDSMRISVSLCSDWVISRITLKEG